MSPEEPYEDRARRRAGLTLAALAVAAIVVVALVFTLGRHTGRSGNTDAAPVATTAGAESTTAQATPSRTVATSSAKPKPKPTASPTTSGQASCAKTPCVLSGDAGKVVAAVSSYRTGKGQPAVAGSVTPAAGACALHSGNAPYCPGSYYWVHVPALQGPAVVAKIESLGGTSWLLNPAMKTISVGCAEAGAGDYSCAVFNAG